MKKRSKVARRSVGGVHAVIVKRTPGIGVWTVSVPDRKQDGNYFQTIKDVPSEDIIALIDCLMELKDGDSEST
jgi:hypothetical protein